MQRSLLLKFDRVFLCIQLKFYKIDLKDWFEKDKSVL